MEKWDFLDVVKIAKNCLIENFLPENLFLCE